MFKSAIVFFCISFSCISLSFAQVTVNNENDFHTHMDTANPNILIGDTINFDTSFRNINNKIVTISLNSGVSFNGSSMHSTGNGFVLSGSTLTFISDISNTVSGFPNAFSGTGGSVLNFDGGLTFSDNYGSLSGGILSLTDSSETNFNGSYVFRKGTSDQSGGAIYAENASSVIFSTGSALFENNSASAGGAAMLASGSKMDFDGSNITFRQNSALTAGGAILLSGDSIVSFNASGSIFFNLNKAPGSGGAAYITEFSLVDFNAKNIYFRNNYSDESAGAIYAVSGSTINLNGNYIEFRRNIGKYSGGALHISGNSYFNISADTIVFETNGSKNNDGQAADGGVAYASNSHFDFNGKSAFFQDNDALGRGGAFFATDNSVFNFNSATNTFSGNESLASGGAIYSELHSRFVFNGENMFFDNNSASSFGGAIAAVSNSTFTISSLKAHFQYNRAADGGAIYADNAAFTFNGNELCFTGNAASHSGGALYAENNAVLNFLSSSNLFRYNRGADGGAIYMEASDIIIDNARFLNNKASSSGGAVYMIGNSDTDTSDLNIRALTADVFFGGNTDSGGANDIYMHQYGNIEFNAAAGRKITLEGGISARDGFGNSIIKTGVGILEFGGDYSNYKGDLKISSGTLLVINDAAVSAANFEVESGAKYSTVDGYGNQVTTVGSGKINGEINIDIDFSAYKADKIIADSAVSSVSDGKLNLNTGSSININASGSLGLGTTKINIFEAENGIIGGFSNDNFASVLALLPADATATVKYTPNSIDLYVSRLSSFNTITKMTHNQKKVALSLDEIAKANTTGAMSFLMTQVDSMSSDSMKRAAFDRLSGSFIANAITAGALRNGANELYDRLQPRYCPHEFSISQSLWGQFYFSHNRYDEDDNSVSDFDVNGYGIQAGYDLFTGQNSAGGLYISYGHNDLEQGDDEADMRDYALGVYAGHFGKKMDIKGSLSGGVQKFDLKRNIKFAGLKTNADFDTYSIRADGQVEFKVGIGDGSFELRPFIGLQGGYVVNEKIKEKNGEGANLIVDSGEYLRISGTGGIGVAGGTEKFNWHGKAYAGYLMAGTKNEIDGKFKDNGQKMNIWGAELGEFGGGAGISGEYLLTKQWSIYAGANAVYAEGSSGYYGNVGINYSLCSDTSRVKKAQKEKIRTGEISVYDKILIEEEKKDEIAAVYAETSDTSIDTNIVYDEPAAAETAAPVTGISDLVKIDETDKKDYGAGATAEEKAAVTSSIVPATYSVAGSSSENMVEYKETASFVTDAHGIGSFEKEKIRRQAEEIKKRGYNKIIIRGHTDSSGDDTINNRLSLQRAKAVYEEFIANGIDPEKIEFVGYADRQPAASNATEAGMSLNRRTDIVVDGPMIAPGVIYTASYFVTNGYGLPREIKEKVKQQVYEINSIDYRSITIEGHADSTGNDWINDRLSTQRAKTIYDEFINNGIPSDKLSYKGYGSRMPIDTNSTRKGRANNRRVEVIVK